MINIMGYNGHGKHNKLKKRPAVDAERYSI